MGEFTAHESEWLVTLAGERCSGVGIVQTSLRGSTGHLSLDLFFPGEQAGQSCDSHGTYYDLFLY